MFVLGAMFASLFHISMGMDMMATGSDCLYMSHQETLCPMNVLDHLGAWQSVFLSVIPSIVLLMVAASAVSLAVFTLPHLLSPKPSPIPILYRQLRERTYSFTQRFLQELFSNGILHPKVF